VPPLLTPISYRPYFHHTQCNSQSPLEFPDHTTCLIQFKPQYPPTRLYRQNSPAYHLQNPLRRLSGQANGSGTQEPPTRKARPYFRQARSRTAMIIQRITTIQIFSWRSGALSLRRQKSNGLGSPECSCEDCLSRSEKFCTHSSYIKMVSWVFPRIKDAFRSSQVGNRAESHRIRAPADAKFAAAIHDQRAS
jgi:hypothetical protein